MPYGGFGPGGAPNLAVTACPFGCVEVFALIPEPGSLALLSTALGIMGGFGWRRRQSLNS
ncbi:MAG: PEP-CTERM sorting domain-containing protein [Burkholderiales bacterium]